MTEILLKVVLNTITLPLSHKEQCLVYLVIPIKKNYDYLYIETSVKREINPSKVHDEIAIDVCMTDCYWRC